MYKKNSKFEKKSSYSFSGKRDFKKDFGQVSERDTYTDKKLLESKPIREIKKSNKAESFVNRKFSEMSYSSLTIKNDPNTEVGLNSKPVPWLSSNNPIVDANYKGDTNFSGRNLTALATYGSSTLGDAIDWETKAIALNYLYIGRSGSRNQRNLSLLWDPLSQIIARSQTESFRRLNFFDLSFDITDPITSHPSYVSHEDDTGNILPFMVIYQSFVQNLGLVPASFRRLMAMERILFDNAGTNETAELAELYGLLKKKTLTAKLKALSELMVNYYLDYKWFDNTSKIYLTPSRWSNEMISPTRILKAYYPLSKFAMSIKTKSAEGRTVTSPLFTFDPDENKYDGDTNLTNSNRTRISYHKALTSLLDAINPYSVQKWARHRHFQANPTSGTDLADVSAQDYFNFIVDRVDVLIRAYSNFNSYMDYFNEAMLIFTKTGLNNWSLNKAFDIEGVEPISLTFNKLVDDIFRADGIRPGSMVFDDMQQRWTGVTVLDRYLGIPTFDDKSGGSFITFSTRSIATNEDQMIHSPANIIPILFATDHTSRAMSRIGYEVTVSSSVENVSNLTGNTMLRSLVFSRLNPLRIVSDQFSIQVPTITYMVRDVRPETVSMMNVFLDKSYGMGKIAPIIPNTKKDKKVNPFVVDESSVIEILSSDTLCLLEFEIGDITNDMHNYYKLEGPFKVTTVSGACEIGIK